VFSKSDGGRSCCYPESIPEMGQGHIVILLLGDHPRVYGSMLFFRTHQKTLFEQYQFKNFRSFIDTCRRNGPCPGCSVQPPASQMRKAAVQESAGALQKLKWPFDVRSSKNKWTNFGIDSMSPSSRIQKLTGFTKKFPARSIMRELRVLRCSIDHMPPRTPHTEYGCSSMHSKGCVIN